MAGGSVLGSDSGLAALYFSTEEVIAADGGEWAVAMVLRKNTDDYAGIMRVSYSDGNMFTLNIDPGGHNTEILDPGFFPIDSMGYPPAGAWCILIVRVVESEPGIFQPFLTVYDLDEQDYVISQLDEMSPLDDQPFGQASANFGFIFGLLNEIAYEGLTDTNLYLAVYWNEALDETDVFNLVNNQDTEYWVTYKSPIVAHRFSELPVTDYSGNGWTQSSDTDVEDSEDVPSAWTDIEEGGEDVIQPARIASTAQLFTPTLVPGAVAVQPSAIAGAAQVFAPQVEVAQEEEPERAEPALIASTAQIFTPSFDPGPVTVNPGAIASGALVSTPTVTTGAVSVQVPFLQNTNRLYVPLVTGGDQQGSGVEVEVNARRAINQPDVYSVGKRQR